MKKSHFANGYHDRSMMGHGGGMKWIAPVIMLVFWSALLSGVIYMTRSKMKMSQMSPLDIAQKRYAKGEISRDDLESIKRGLES